MQRLCFSCRLLTPTMWFWNVCGLKRKKRQKNQHQTECSKYILCNVDLFVPVWDCTIHLAASLSSGQGLQKRDSFWGLSSGTCLPSTEERRAGGPFSDPSGWRVAHVWRRAGRTVCSLRLRPALSLTLKQPPLLPPAPHHGPLPPCPNQNPELTRGRVPCF